MARAWRTQVQWDAVTVTILVLLATTAYVVWRFTVPSDCAWLGPDSDSWRPEGVAAHAQSDCPLSHGTLVVGAAADSGTVRYHLAEDRSVLVDRTEHPGDPLGRLRAGAWTTLYTFPQFILCLVMIVQQPRNRAAGAALVFSGGLFGSTLVTQLGLPAASAFEGLPRWLFLANTQITFSLLWGAALLFATLFPTPMTRSAEGLTQRATVAGGPALLYLVVAGAIWVASGGDFLTWAHWSIRAQTSITVFTLLGIAVLLLVRMIRLRGDDGDAVARQQLLWVGGTGLASLTLAISLAFIPQMLGGDALLGSDLIGLPGLLYVVGLGIGLARYRMFDLEWVLVRILVYTALLLLAVGVFALVSVILEALPLDLTPGTGSVVAVIVVALVAPVIRARVERTVNWVVYRDPDDRYKTLSNVADHLSGRSVDFTRVAEDIRRALRIPHLAIRADGVDVAVGIPAGRDAVPGSTPLTFPVVHGDDDLGVLVAWTRGRGDRFSAAERLLLRDLALQVAVAIHQAELAVQLQHSRERLVVAREEERLALRRVLHDDIAPAVAGIGLQAETARQLVARSDAERAAAVLATVGSDALAASQQLRALAYDLRPPALDDRGLVAALEDQGVRMSPIRLEVDAAGLGDLAHSLPAAVEVAAFRIASGALANVHQHAGASRCRVVLRLEGSNLVCEVADDGIGVPEDFRPGVGIASMRERATELGGTLTVGPRDGGGTAVCVELPLEGRDD